MRGWLGGGERDPRRGHRLVVCVFFLDLSETYGGNGCTLIGFPSTCDIGSCPESGCDIIIIIIIIIITLNAFCSN